MAVMLFKLFVFLGAVFGLAFALVLFLDWLQDSLNVHFQKKKDRP